MNAWLTKQQPAPDTSDKHPAFRAFVRYNHQNYAKDGPWPVAEETGHGPASAYLPHDIADQWASAAAGRGHAPADAAAAGDGHALAKAGGCREGSAPRANAIGLAWLVAWSSTAESVTRASAMLRRCRCPALGPICPPATTTASPPPSAVSRRTARWRRPMWSEAGVDDVASGPWPPGGLEPPPPMHCRKLRSAQAAVCRARVGRAAASAASPRRKRSSSVEGSRTGWARFAGRPSAELA